MHACMHACAQPSPSLAHTYTHTPHACNAGQQKYATPALRHALGLFSEAAAEEEPSGGKPRALLVPVDEMVVAFRERNPHGRALQAVGA
jgi:hypothetical protein